MKNKALLFFATELFWWMLFFLLAVLSILPITGFIREDLLLLNGGLAIIFAACFRYVVFFNKVTYFKPTVVKVILFIAIIVFFFWLLNSIQDFLALFDDHDISFFLTETNTITGEQMLSRYGFFKKEFLFFSVGILILMFFLELLVIGGILRRVKKIK